jgi:hypothetical protein
MNTYQLYWSYYPKLTFITLFSNHPHLRILCLLGHSGLAHNLFCTNSIFLEKLIVVIWFPVTVQSESATGFCLGPGEFRPKFSHSVSLISTAVQISQVASFFGYHIFHANFYLRRANGLSTTRIRRRAQIKKFYLCNSFYSPFACK